MRSISQWVKAMRVKTSDWFGELGGTSPEDGEEGDWRRELEEFKAEVGGETYERVSYGLLPPMHKQEYLGEWVLDGENLPGVEKRDENLGENPEGVENGGKIPGDNPMESYQGVDLAREMEQAVDRKMLEVFSQRDVIDWKANAGDEGITTQEFEARIDRLGPLTWRGVDGWMKKVEVEGSGKRWTTRGWVKDRGKSVVKVVGELGRRARGRRGLVDGRRID